MAEEEKVTAVAEEATSMADYEKELEASFKKIEEGDMITGTVIAVDEEGSSLLHRRNHQGFRLQQRAWFYGKRSGSCGR